MKAMVEPFVSVVTPVYNSETHLAECIESVLNQTYSNWEYVIVNNCSTDSSVDIAQQYARKDSRIRVESNTNHLSMMQNGNRALRAISKESKYCKVVHADDWLFPECLEKMVSLAETHPRIGIVSSYRLDGLKVGLDGLPYTRKVIPGPELCRSLLLGAPTVFGSPTSLLLCSEVIRRRQSFYNERYIFGDVEACFEVLEHWDFGFVHQVLTYTRRHRNSASERWFSRHPPGLAGLYCMKKFGPKYLTKEEYAIRHGQKLDDFYKCVAISLLQWRGKAFWTDQCKALKDLGYTFSTPRLLRAVVLGVARPVNILRLGLPRDASWA
jgi:glycosyltransferase involved in cell wall biosynthesis